MKTNAEYYKNSYVEARFAFECYCMDCLARKGKICGSDESCDLCQSRWERLPFDKKAHESMLFEAAAARIPVPFPTNEEADAKLRAAGLLEKEYPAEHSKQATGKTGRLSRPRIRRVGARRTKAQQAGD